MGGFAVTFPFVVVPHEAFGTPDAFDSWQHPVECVLKIMAFVLRDHIAKHLANTGQLPVNATIVLSAHKYPDNKCPFDIVLLEELPGAPQSVAISRPIGFVHGA